MENTGGSRAGYTELGQLVQQRAFARADRAHPSSGGGKRLLSANGRSGQSGLTKPKQPPEKPGTFRVATVVYLTNLVSPPGINENTHLSLFLHPRPPTKPARTVPAAQLSDHLGFNRPSNAFGDHFPAQIAGQPGDGAHDGAVGGVVVYVMNKTAVNLQPLHRQAVQIAQ